MGKLRAKPPKPRKRHAPRWVGLERRLPKGSLFALLLGPVFAGLAVKDCFRARPNSPPQLWLHAIAVLAGTALFLWAVWRLRLHAKPCYTIKVYDGGFTARTDATFRYRYRGDASDLARVTFQTGHWNTGGCVHPAVHVTGCVEELPPEALAEGVVKLAVPEPTFGRPPTLWVEITDRKGHRRDSVYSIP